MLSTKLSALFLLSAFTLYLPSTTAQPVLDTDGEVVENRVAYYMLPVLRGKGGGIELAATGNETCPLTVVQSRREVSKGIPIMISCPYVGPCIAFEHGILNIGFTVVSRCAPIPSAWNVVKGLPEGQAVKITGYEFENVVIGAFTIEKASLDHNSYKLLFCTFGDKLICKDIGIHIDVHGNRRLVVAENNPFLFQLQKVTSSTA
ncbi:Kunitz-type trypsin inhibitor KTI1 [Spatholobus suberectus]|nr:Kunitz-type trypsin inhibitor KTI1 [Spatholobus suberectus]